MTAPPPIAVLGAGLMGHGIAYLFAAAGHEVRVHDPVACARYALPKRLGEIRDLLGGDAALLGRVTVFSDLAEAVGDAAVVIEAAPEKLELKRQLFADLNRLTRHDAILASNTSVIPITEISTAVRDRTRVLGAHFW